jgi:hypothetical protein
MKRRHLITSIGAFSASGSVVIGSGAFTSAQVERPVSIDVVPDDEGFLGLRYPNAEGDEERDPVDLSTGRAELLFAMNEFGGATELETFSVDLQDTPCLELRFDPPDPFTPGEGVQVDVVADCAGTCPEEFTVEIRASGDGVDVAAERTFTVVDGCGADTECQEINETGNRSVTLQDASIACLNVNVGGKADIAVEDVCVDGSVTITAKGTSDVTLTNCSVGGDVEITRNGNANVTRTNLCIDGDLSIDGELVDGSFDDCELTCGAD